LDLSYPAHSISTDPLIKMGKKGKKSKPKPSTGGGDHEHQQHENQQRTMIEHLGDLNLNREEKATPDGAACYFCLGEEGDDEEGKLLDATAPAAVILPALPTSPA
jgi:hypothetical protein